MHDDLDRLDEVVAQHVVGDDLGQPLDEVEGRPGDARDDVVGHLGVVDRGGEGVGAPGRLEVEDHRHVDEEGLAVALLEVEHAVVAAGRDALQHDAVGHQSASSGVVGCVLEGRLHDRSARTVEATSWTRTHHSPAIAAITEVAVVSTSRSAAGRGAAPSSRPRRPRKVLREAPSRIG